MLKPYGPRVRRDQGLKLPLLSFKKHLHTLTIKVLSWLTPPPPSRNNYEPMIFSTFQILRSLKPGTNIFPNLWNNQKTAFYPSFNSKVLLPSEQFHYTMFGWNGLFLSSLKGHLSQISESKMNLDGRSEATRGHGIDLRQLLALMNSLIHLLGLHISWSCYPRPACIQASELSMLSEARISSDSILDDLKLACNQWKNKI